MSLFGALSSSVTGLSAQGEAISVISDNLANTNTIGYKASRTLFSQMVTSSGVSGTTFNSGGVSTDIQRAQNIQGSLQSTDSSTDLALSGSGFFVLVNESSVGPETSKFYTRAGSFSESAMGYLQHPSGNYLLGWKTDSAGDIVDIQNPQPVELQTVSSSASPTGELQLGITLNADTDIYNYDSSKTHSENLDDVVADPTTASYVSDERFYDAQGGARDMSIGYIKRSDNVWDYVVYTDGSNIVSGVEGINTRIGSGTLIFKEDGSLESSSGQSLSIPWSGGVPAGEIDLDFGDAKGGYIIDNETQMTGALALEQSIQATVFPDDANHTLTIPVGAANGNYTVSYDAGANTYELTHPGGTLTMPEPAVIPGDVTFNVGTGLDVVLNVTVLPALTTANLEEVNAQNVGGVISSYLDEDQYLTEHGATATIQGNYAISWNDATDELELTDPTGTTYTEAVPATPTNRVVEFANGFTLTLGMSWTAPTTTMALGTVQPTNVQPIGSGVGTDGALQLASSNNVRFSIQNGFGAGELSAITVDKEGYVVGSFTNGETNKLFKLVVGVFQNPSALEPVSGNLFTQTEASGLPLNKEAGIGGTATVVSGALEQSTVDIANEFSQLIVTQRAYQANSKVVTTVDQMLNELLNLR
ncbi:MAG: flagellar hook-basal body complex protein [Proteobacteria bacterium]|nr:flagellar hook-basal body complex protein [Pseudomonadota bacterium]